jgi:hypothetical protein
MKTNKVRKEKESKTIKHKERKTWNKIIDKGRNTPNQT